MKDFSGYTDMRDVYVDTLLEIAQNDSRLVVLEADSMGATGTRRFLEAFPERFINTGTAEANMIGIASGLSSQGFIPFASTFGSFAVRRANDQFFVSANYAGQQVKLVGIDPGITAQFNGGTHMPFCDIALTRVIPRLVVVEPADPVTLYELTKQIFDQVGCAYIRLQRRGAACIHDSKTDIKLGKGIVIKDGSDVTLIAVGMVMLQEALRASCLLKEKGISSAVIDMHTVKPLDADLIMEYAGKTKILLTCENAQIAGGLGGAVAELVSGVGCCRVVRIGVHDEFGEAGTLKYLKTRFKLTAEDIAHEAVSAFRGVK